MRERAVESELRERFVEREASHAVPALKAWVDEPRVRANVARWVDDWMTRAATGAAAIVEPEVGPAALVRVRRRTDNERRASAEVLCRTGGWASAEEVRAFERALGEAFAGADAVPSAWIVHRHRGETPDAAWGRPYKSVLATSLAALAAREAREPGLTVEPVAGLEFAAEYETEYRRWWEGIPEALERRVRVEPREALRRYRDAGGLGLVRVDGTPAGVVAAERACEHGMRGWTMRERFLYERFRGRGLGGEVLVKFARLLNTDSGEAEEEGSLLWGMIAAENAASRKSAERTGRQAVGEYRWAGVEMGTPGGNSAHPRAV